MIAVNPQVTELAAGYAHIQDFLDTMRTTWLPGFEHSYQRRSSEYRKALEKHEQRGLFLRTLLGKPKAPNRLPARYPGALESRLLKDWRASFSLVASGKAASNDQSEERFDESFLELLDLHLTKDLVIERVIVGPPGVLLIDQESEDRLILSGSDQAQADKRSMTTEILERSAAHETVIHAAARDTWQELLADMVTKNRLDTHTIFQLADALLLHHQAFVEGRPFSARETAQKLTEREKTNLLRMAATL